MDVYYGYFQIFPLNLTVRQLKFLNSYNIKNQQFFLTHFLKNKIHFFFISLNILEFSNKC